MYGVPSGKSVGGSTEWKTDVILPVMFDTTIVASVSRPPTTALEEASTRIGGVGRSRSIGGGGVVAWGAMLQGGSLSDWTQTKRTGDCRQ